MRFVIANHAYDEFLEWLYKGRPQLAGQAFATQLSAYYETMFASSDFYAHALGSLGHEVHEFVVNNLHAQRTWLKEHKTSSFNRWLDQMRGRNGFGVFGPKSNHSSSFDMLLEQIRLVRPDVLYNQSVYAFDDDQLCALKAHTGLLVGEHAAMSLPETINYRLYDLIVSSFPPTIDWLQARGVKAELNRLAFDPRVLSLVPEKLRDIQVSFVGSFLPIHSSRLELVEAVVAQVPKTVVNGSVATDISSSSPLAGRIGPALWGRDMYALLGRSLVTLNHHGNVPPFANNMRLYEATGMGCLLITDQKDNLHEMFEPEREVVTYRDAAECVDKVRYYLDARNRAACRAIALAGQKRTLRDHTYRARMEHLVDLIRAI
jgi:spore maturation protein CgeB